MDRTYYLSRFSGNYGVQEDLINISKSMCNFIAIYQNAYFHERKVYASRQEELAVISALVLEDERHLAGVTQNDCFVLSHEQELKWLKLKGFLKRPHDVIVVKTNNSSSLEDGHYVVQFVSQDKSTNHFINCKVDRSNVSITHDGYRDSYLSKFGNVESFRTYPCTKG